jgi:hypothetical protein
VGAPDTSKSKRRTCGHTDGFLDCSVCKKKTCSECLIHSDCCDKDICADCFSESPLYSCSNCECHFHDEGCEEWGLDDVMQSVRCTMCAMVLACSRCLAASTSLPFLSCPLSRRTSIHEHPVLCLECAEDWDGDWQELGERIEDEGADFCDCESDDEGEHLSKECFFDLRWAARVRSLASALSGETGTSKSNGKGKGKGKGKKEEDKGSKPDYFRDEFTSAMLFRVLHVLKRDDQGDDDDSD